MTPPTVLEPYPSAPAVDQSPGDGLSVVNTSPPRIDGVEKVTGSALYAADYSLPGMLYGKILRSEQAHARIVHINKNKALALEGVKAVITHADVPHVLHPGAPAPRVGQLVADQYVLAEKARYFGDGIAAVAATTEEIAEEALHLLAVEYEPLPPVFDVEEAQKPGAPSIHGTEGNLVGPPFIIERGDVDKGFANADAIFEGHYETGRPVPCYMEPNACLCRFDRGGKLTIWSSTQCAFMVRGILSQVLDIPAHDVRVIVEHMGGGFGAKQDLYQHEFVCALLARETHRPVKMEYTRKESFLGGRSRHPTKIYLKQGLAKDGTLTAREVRYKSNTGGYASHGLGITAVGCLDIASLYRCEENLKIEGIAVYTNNPIAGAYRGFGAVQAFFALETQIDEMAVARGEDPLDFRLKNIVGDGDLSPSEHKILGDGLAACLKRGAEETNWYERKKVEQPKEKFLKRGWGVATEMHSSGAYPDINEQSNAIVKMNEDGTVNLLIGMADLGTGTRTMAAQITAETLGIPLKDISVIDGDTDIAPFDIGAYASRTTFVGGGAVLKAANHLKRQLLELASKPLNTRWEELALGSGRVFVKKSPNLEISLKDLVAGEGGRPPRTVIGQGNNEPTVAYSFGAHFAEVEVDIETGQVRVLQVVAVHEIGKAINPNAVAGQIEGGVQQGIGHSLTEDFIIDKKTGRPLNPSFVDYKMPLALDMPKIKTIILEEFPDPGGPFGAKGIGEDPIIPIGPAIGNAVYDATGVRMRELPITPEKFLKALAEV